MNASTSHTPALTRGAGNESNTALTRAAGYEGNTALTRAAGNESRPASSSAPSVSSEFRFSSSAAGISPQFRAPVKHSKLRRKNGHDYTKPAAYLITVSTTGRQRLLGSLAGDSPDTAHIIPTALGTAVIAAFRDIESKVKEKTGCRVQVLQYQLMPDHFHGILYIRDPLPASWHLGKIIGAWKGACSRAYWSLTAALTRGAGNEGNTALTRGAGDERQPLFSAGYNDRPLLNRGQLQGWIAYLRDNPRRLWLKHHYPDRLRKTYNFRAGESGTAYTAVGNTFLLTYPDRQQVRCHRNLTPEQIQAEVEHYLTLARAGVVLISPFISPAEKAVYEACYSERLRMVRLVKRAMDGQFVYPQGRNFDGCVQGFLLVLSPFPTGSEEAAERSITRDQCLSLNDYAADLASSARRIREGYNGRVPTALTRAAGNESRPLSSSAAGSLSSSPSSSFSSTAAGVSPQPNPMLQ